MSEEIKEAKKAVLDASVAPEEFCSKTISFDCGLYILENNPNKNR